MFDADATVSMAEVRTVLDACKDADEGLVDKALKEVAKSSQGKTNLSFLEFKNAVKRVFI